MMSQENITPNMLNKLSTKPKTRSTTSAAKRYGPKPVKSVLVFQAYNVMIAKMAHVMPAASTTLCHVYAALMNPTMTPSNPVNKKSNT
mmetsp:Transcript_663/g.1301  ORF Transcript_663/g.1301 Transcript_663/m.1301 type:complete len:88 (+) Transcript_663:349-612(+)